MFSPPNILSEFSHPEGQETRIATKGRSGQEIIGLFAQGIGAFREGQDKDCDRHIASGLVLLHQTLEQNNPHLRLGDEVERIRKLLTAISPFTPEYTEKTISSLVEKLNLIYSPESDTERTFLDLVCAEIVELIINKKSPAHFNVLSRILKRDKRLSPFSRLIQSEKISALENLLNENFAITVTDEESASKKEHKTIEICKILLDLLHLKHHPSQIHLINVYKMTGIFRSYWQKEGYQDSLREIGGEIEVAALYHDLGKLAVNNSILDSNQPLNPEQRFIMNSHAEKSASILKALLDQAGKQKNNARMIRAVANHHQSYDGGGYPNQGIKGKTIGFEAQVISALDMLEAMTSDGRSYREKSDLTKTLDKIANDKPRKIAPEICALLFDMRDKGYWDGFFGIQESNKISGNPTGLNPQTKIALAEWFEDRSSQS